MQRIPQGVCASWNKIYRPCMLFMNQQVCLGVPLSIYNSEVLTGSTGLPDDLLFPDSIHQHPVLLVGNNLS